MRAIALCALTLLVAGAARAQTPPTTEAPRAIVSFQSLYGVDGPFLGKDGALRHIPGDDLPWTVDAVEGSVMDNGAVRIRIQGLVFADDPSVPPDMVGTNDSPTFRAVLSCLQESPDGDVRVVNHFTNQFAATPEGDSNISERIAMPDECVAPLVFILSGTEHVAFALSGAELAE